MSTHLKKVTTAQRKPFHLLPSPARRKLQKGVRTKHHHRSRRVEQRGISRAGGEGQQVLERHGLQKGGKPVERYTHEADDKYHGFSEGLVTLVPFSRAWNVHSSSGGTRSDPNTRRVGKHDTNACWVPALLFPSQRSLFTHELRALLALRPGFAGSA